MSIQPTPPSGSSDKVTNRPVETKKQESAIGKNDKFLAKLALKYGEDWSSRITDVPNRTWIVSVIGAGEKFSTAVKGHLQGLAKYSRDLVVAEVRDSVKNVSSIDKRQVRQGAIGEYLVKNGMDETLASTWYTKTTVVDPLIGKVLSFAGVGTKNERPLTDKEKLAINAVAEEDRAVIEKASDTSVFNRAIRDHHLVPRASSGSK